MEGIGAEGSDEIYDRVKSHKGIESVVCMDKAGNHVRPPKGFDDEESATEYGQALNHLLERATAACRDLNPTVCNLFLAPYLIFSHERTSRLWFHPIMCVG
jgi:hypothetical protein